MRGTRAPTRGETIIPGEGSLTATAATPAAALSPVVNGVDQPQEPGWFIYHQARAAQVDTADAVRLLEALRHPGERIWLQVFADAPHDAYIREEAALKKGSRPSLCWRLNGVPKTGGDGVCGPLSGVAERAGWVTPQQLQARPYLNENMARCGVFFCVNVLAADAGKRRAENITRVAAVFLDLDGKPLPAAFPIQPTAVVESSPGRYHVYWAADGVPLEEFTTLQKGLASIYGGDTSVSDLPRVMRLPGYWHSKKEPFLVTLRELHPEAHYTRDDLLQAWPQLREALATAKREQKRQGQARQARLERADELSQQADQGLRGQTYGEVALRGLEADMLSAQEGQRNTTLNAVAYRAGRLIRAELLNEDDVCARLTEAATQTGLDTGEIASTLRSGIEAGKQNPIDTAEIGSKSKPRAQRDITPTTAPQQPVEAPTTTVTGYVIPRLSEGTEQGTDEANAQILAANLKDRLRYTIGLGWLVYQQKRGVWLADPERVLASQVAGQVLRRVISQMFAAAVEARAGEAELRRISRWAASVGNNKTIQAALQSAAGKREFLTPFDAWDAHPHLLNCLNGTLDLRTGVLLPHDPTHLLTWQTGTAYDPSASHPYVDRLIELLRADGREQFLQRSVGSALWGEAPNEVLIILQGEGGTGKGTLVAAVTGMLGNYATTTDVNLLLSNPRGEAAAGPKPELLALRGRRLVIAGEPPKGAIFNAGRVKALTGNDPITARNMHSPTMVTFAPVFKLWLHTNYPIGASHDDSGLQRRLRVVPFEAKPKRADPTFKRTLERDRVARSALLNWALEGCRAWLTSGYDLGYSEAVSQATGGYWREQNPYEQFVAELLEFEPRSEIPSGRLKMLFEEWAVEKGDEVKRNVKLAELHGYLRQHGCEAVKGARGARRWVGIKERA